MRQNCTRASTVLRHRIAHQPLRQPGLMCRCTGKRGALRPPAPTARARSTAESTADPHLGSRRPSSATSLVRWASTLRTAAGEACTRLTHSSSPCSIVVTVSTTSTAITPADAARRSSYAARRQRCEHHFAGLPASLPRSRSPHRGHTPGTPLRRPADRCAAGACEPLAPAPANPSPTIIPWAYARFYTSEDERRAALPGWLHFYNHHRLHSAIGNQTPFSRLTNVPGHHI
jgi:transposase InsO family protein